MIKGVLWNLLGTGVPLLVALWAVPHLLQGYGNERFGLLSIIWALIGYFSIFDLGLGRALTKLVAERLGSNRQTEIPDLVATAIAIIFSLGLSASFLGAISSSWLVGDILKMDESLTQEGINAMKILSVGLPFVVLSAALIGLLEARGDFKSINAIRLLMGLSNFIGPVISLQWSASLVDATLILVFMRIFTTFLYAYRCWGTRAFGEARGRINRTMVKPLFQFGAWITISNVISPIMVQLDRFLIGAVIGVTRLPLYVIPADMLIRLSFMPAALINVLFPAFTKAMVESPQRGADLFNKSCTVMLWCLVPISLVVCLYAPEGLTLWMGADFSEGASPIVRWLVVGFFFNGMARIPHALLQSSGRPDLTAKLHIIEFPVYFVLMWILLKNYGILGAAVGWMLRMLLDMGLLFYVAAKKIPIVSNFARDASIKSLGIGLLFLLATLLDRCEYKNHIGFCVTLLTTLYAAKNIVLFRSFSHEK